MVEGVILSKKFILTTLPKNGFCLLDSFVDPFSNIFINKVVLSNGNGFSPLEGKSVHFRISDSVINQA